jgi:hypothetical protein
MTVDDGLLNGRDLLMNVNGLLERIRDGALMPMKPGKTSL